MGTIAPEMHLWRGSVVGLVGGLVAAGAMSLAYRALTPLVPAPRAAAPAGDGSDDATVRVADGVMRRLAGRPLAEEHKPLAGTLVHYAFGGCVGALYGGVAELVPRVATARGLAFGTAVWLGAHVLVVPAAGLAPPPTRRPRSQEAIELLLHLVYGVVTEAVRRRGRAPASRLPGSDASG
jgi:uncharacterized membrane protein YagU involved in acid resistance